MSSSTELQAWLNGVVGGGPESDGRYPLTYADTLTYLVYCPAAQALNPALAEAPIEVYSITASNAAAVATAESAEAEQASTDAQTYAANAATSASAANIAKVAAQLARNNAQTAEANAELAETNAETAASAAAASESAAAISASDAADSATAADASADAAAASAASVAASMTGSITDGDTTHTPTGNAVFDALALKANAASPTFSGTMTLPSAAGSMLLSPGTGDGASYTTYNSKINLHWGLAFGDYTDTVRGVYDARTGTWDTKGGYKVDGQSVWHAGSFNPALKADLASPTFTGVVTLPEFRWIGVAGSSMPTDDINSIVRPGFWRVESTSANKPAGATSYGTVLAMNYVGNTRSQLYFDVTPGAADGMWFRHTDTYADDGQTYTSWKKVWHDGNLPVSEAASVSTVVKRTANGYTYANYFNTTADVTPTPASHIAMQASSDGFIRWQTPAQFIANHGIHNRASLGTVALAISDWNLTDTTGWYMAAGATNAPSVPGGNWLIGHVVVHNADWITQEVWQFTADIPAQVKWRRQKSAGTWGAWEGRSHAYAHFNSVTTAVVLSTTGVGTVYLRPNGPDSATAEATLDSAGNFIAPSLRPSNPGTSYFSGNGSGIQKNGLFYTNGTDFTLAANGAAWIRTPRLFVGGSDPGAQASDGDIWIP